MAGTGAIRVCYFNRSYWPDTGATGQLLTELAEDLARFRGPLRDVFPAALLGRLVVIPYYPLNRSMIEAIVKLQLGRIRKRIEWTRKIPFTYDDSVIELITRRCSDPESGGRVIDAILTNTMLPALSHEFLTRMMQGLPIERVHVGAKDSEFTYDFGVGKA